ncbi:hypothetical protein TVAG_367640 [Trichomonas vaginalis G3]|uniref:Uncharacterized protein n=1 Tax=Trichomonas vaginalis (strain ATCC PRA-98 / G3) TaxID=412133 RepID=A2F5R8_TRIV3|nr:hypothetical protein TVAGG3_0977620 [Trichomonas vaginalis G3]EAX99768.1 hypothetical protein TVAG_367640 [Trichomonas vaginalis G3]KAI5489053.1 hypothetical protein TVAGG3_0977620 [Trichomonas vaginalis G3]|eukprot:XP_001312698.1 hypothetical protein [Trichomonas vaginalis G3]
MESNIFELVKQLLNAKQGNVEEIQWKILEFEAKELFDAFLICNEKNVALMLFFAMKNTDKFNRFISEMNFQDIFSIIENLYEKISPEADDQDPIIMLIDYIISLSVSFFQTQLQQIINFISQDSSFIDKSILTSAVLLQSLDVKKIPFSIRKFFKEFENHIFETFKSNNKDINFNVYCFYIYTISTKFPILLNIEDFSFIFATNLIESHPNDLQKYLDMISYIIIAKYNNAFEFLDFLLPFYNSAISIDKNISLNSIMIIAEHENSLKQFNENLHEDYQQNKEEIYNISTNIFMNFCKDDILLYENYFTYLMNVDLDFMFERTSELFQNYINEGKIAEVYQIFINIPRNQQFFDFIFRNQETFISFICSNEFVIEENCSLLKNYPELIIDENIISNIIQTCNIPLIIDLFESISSNRLFNSSESIRQICNSFIELISQPIQVSVESVDLMLSYLIDIVPDYVPDIIENLVNLIFENQNLVYSIESIINKFSFDNQEIYDQFIQYLFNSCEQSPQILNCFASIVKRCEIISDETVEFIINMIHNFLEVDCAKTANLITCFSLNFREKTKEIGEEVFLHISSYFSPDGYDIKAMADMISAVYSIEEAEEPFLEKISQSLLKMKDCSATYAINVGYALMVAAATYFAQETASKDLYFENLISYLQKCQLIEDDINELIDLYIQTAKTIIVFAKFLNQGQKRLILKKNIIQILKEGIQFQKSNQICEKALNSLQTN